MKRIVLWALFSVPVLFWLFRSFSAPISFFAVGFLATAMYFVTRYVRPWFKEHTTQKPESLFRFYGYLPLTSFLSLIAGSALFIELSNQPGAPLPLQGHGYQVNVIEFNLAAVRLAFGGVEDHIRFWTVPEN